MNAVLSDIVQRAMSQGLITISPPRKKRRPNMAQPFARGAKLTPEQETERFRGYYRSRVDYFYSKGLTCDGKPRTYKQRPELKHLKPGSKEWRRIYMQMKRKANQ